MKKTAGIYKQGSKAPFKFKDIDLTKLKEHMNDFYNSNPIPKERQLLS